MGSEKGQDNERPVHRVWLDEFALGECQVTHAEYAQFLAATGHAQPPHWNDPEFSHPQQPVVAVSWFDAVAYCEWLSARRGAAFGCPPRLNGSGLRAEAWNRMTILGETVRRNRCRIILRDGRRDRSRWARRSEMRSGFATWERTSTSGARIGSARITMPRRRIAIHRGPRRGHAARPEADRGGTTPKFRAARRDRASRPSFNMPTTDFAWRAIRR